MNLSLVVSYLQYKFNALFAKKPITVASAITSINTIVASLQAAEEAAFAESVTIQYAIDGLREKKQAVLLEGAKAVRVGDKLRELVA